MPCKWSHLIPLLLKLLTVLVCVFFVLSITLNVLDIIKNYPMIDYASTCSCCRFATYELIIIVFNSIIICSMLLGFVIIICKHNEKYIRYFLISIFFLVLAQGMLLCTYLKRYPIARDVHSAWGTLRMQTYETEFQCCGKLGASDYKKLNQTIPTSCYHIDARGGKRKLNKPGCMIAHPTIFGMDRGIYKFPVQVILFVLLYILKKYVYRDKAQ